MLGRSCCDFIKRALIGIAGIIQRHIQFDGKIGRPNQQNIHARHRSDGIKIFQRLLGFDHGHNDQFLVHRIHIVAVFWEFAPFTAHARIATIALRIVAAGTYHCLSLGPRIDHGGNDATRAGIQCEANLIRLVRGNAHQGRRLLAAHRLNGRRHLLDFIGGVLGVEQDEIKAGISQHRYINIRPRSRSNGSFA